MQKQNNAKRLQKEHELAIFDDSPTANFMKIWKKRYFSNQQTAW